MAVLSGLRSWRDRRRYRGPKVTGTRAERALPMMALGGVALAAMYGLVGSNVLAVNFTTTDREFEVYSNYLDGVEAGGYLDSTSRYGADTTTCPGATTASTQCGTAEIGINDAKLAGLCLIAHQKIDGLGEVSLLVMAGVPVRASFSEDGNTTTDGTLPTAQPISVVPAGQTATAPDGSTLVAGQLSGTSWSNAVHAEDLYLDTNSLSGYGNLLSGLNLGQDASGVATQAQLNNGQGSWPGTGQPTPGNFGLSAVHLNVGGLDASSYGVNLAGTVTLPELKLKVLAKDATQADCQTEGQWTQ